LAVNFSSRHFVVVAKTFSAFTFFHDIITFLLSVRTKSGLKKPNLKAILIGFATLLGPRRSACRVQLSPVVLKTDASSSGLTTEPLALGISAFCIPLRMSSGTSPGRLPVTFWPFLVATTR